MAITMTSAAEQHVLKHLEHRTMGVGIRLGVRTTGCSGLSYVLEFVDAAADEDEIFEFGDFKIKLSNAKNTSDNINLLHTIGFTQA